MRPMLPSTFPDGVGLHHFLYGAQSHGPLRSLSTLRPWSRPQHRKTRFQLYLRPWLGGVGYPQGFDSRFQLMAASSSTRLGLAHQGDREIGSRASPDFWVSRCRPQVECALLSSEEIFFVSVLRTKKCVLAPRSTPDLPVKSRSCEVAWFRHEASAIRAAVWQPQGVMNP